jgi:hypothetical protein
MTPSKVRLIRGVLRHYDMADHILDRHHHQHAGQRWVPKLDGGVADTSIDGDKK